MLRWKYIIQRAAFVSFILGLLWLLMNPLLRIAITRGGAQAVGAKVEIGRLRSRLTQTDLQIDGLAIADPRDPMQNLFEAGTAHLDLDAGQLLRRRLVVNGGRLSGIRLGTPREASGEMQGPATPNETSRSWTQQLGTSGEQWLRQAQDRLTDKLTGDLESVSLGKELVERWPQEFDRLESDVRSVGVRGETMLEKIKTLQQAPLQAVQNSPQLFAEIDALRTESEAIRDSLAELQRQMQVDRAAIQSAKEHDIHYVEEHLEITKLDPAALSEYLLGPELGGRIQQLIGWIQWGRSQFQGENSRPATRGVDIWLPGMRAGPSFLVEQLSVDGSGSSNDQEFSFDGVVRGLTHQPRIYGRPAIVELQTRGAIGMQIEASLDHSGRVSHDRIVIRCPKLPQSARVLGSRDRLAMQVGPGIASLDIELELRDDDLQGLVTFRQPSVSLNADVPDKSTLLASRIDAVVSEIQELDAELHLDGSLSAPRWQLASNLGRTLASGLENALRDELRHRQEELVGHAHREIDSQLNALQNRFAQTQEELLNKLNLEQLDGWKQEITGAIPNQMSDKLLGEQGLLNDLLR